MGWHSYRQRKIDEELDTRMITLQAMLEYLNANDCEMRYSLSKGVRCVMLIKRYQRVSFYINPEDLHLSFEDFKDMILQPQMDHLNRKL